jgi:hypothetical protein
VAFHIIGRLEDLESEASAAIPSLRSRLNDSDELVRDRARSALHHIDPVNYGDDFAEHGEGDAANGYDGWNGK